MAAWQVVYVVELEIRLVPNDGTPKVGRVSGDLAKVRVSGFGIALY